VIARRRDVAATLDAQLRRFLDERDAPEAFQALFWPERDPATKEHRA
jgi:hypothetical protein